MEKLRPVGHNVLVKPFDDDTVYKGVIHLPDTAKQLACDGVVIATGEWVDPATVKPGDWVVFSNRQVKHVEHEGKPHFMLVQHAILVVIEDDV